MILFLTIGTVFLVRIHQGFGSHWHYPDLDKNEEFPSWGGICDNGILQSPININKNRVLYGKYNDLKFDNYDRMQYGMEIINNDHTILVQNFSHPAHIYGGPLLGKYKLEQLHLHWWSEHTLDDTRFPLEIHLVHRNVRYPNLTMAQNFKDGIMVLGILYHASDISNKGIDGIVINVDKVKSKEMIDNPVTMTNNFALSDLMNEIVGYMTYAGSLTTPTCSETVTWIILSKTIPVTLDQIKNLREIEKADGKLMTNNYRFIQATNNRPVVKVSLIDPFKSGAHLFSSSFYMVILAVISSRCLLKDRNIVIPVS